MKKHLFLKILLFLLVAGITETKAQILTFSIECEEFKLKRPRYNCERAFGLCIRKCKLDIKLPIRIFERPQEVPPKQLVAFTPDRENGTVTIRFLQDLSRDPEFEGVLEIDEDEEPDYLIELTDGDAEKLGFRTVQLTAGRYEVQPEKGCYGVVVVPARFTNIE